MRIVCQEKQPNQVSTKSGELHGDLRPLQPLRRERAATGVLGAADQRVDRVTTTLRQARD